MPLTEVAFLSLRPLRLVGRARTGSHPAGSSSVLTQLVFARVELPHQGLPRTSSTWEHLEYHSLALITKSHKVKHRSGLKRSYASRRNREQSCWPDTAGWRPDQTSQLPLVLVLHDSIRSGTLVISQCLLKILEHCTQKGSFSALLKILRFSNTEIVSYCRSRCDLECDRLCFRGKCGQERSHKISRLAQSPL